MWYHRVIKEHRVIDAESRIFHARWTTERNTLVLQAKDHQNGDWGETFDISGLTKEKLEEFISFLSELKTAIYPNQQPIHR